MAKYICVRTRTSNVSVCGWFARTDPVKPFDVQQNNVLLALLAWVDWPQFGPSLEFICRRYVLHKWLAGSSLPVFTQQLLWPVLPEVVVPQPMGTHRWFASIPPWGISNSPRGHTSDQSHNLMLSLVHLVLASSQRAVVEISFWTISLPLVWIMTAPNNFCGTVVYTSVGAVDQATRVGVVAPLPLPLTNLNSWVLDDAVDTISLT